MIKKHLITALILGVAILFVSAGIYAASAPDVIPLKDPSYEKHTKGIVQFEHKKHWDDYSKAYPDLYPSKCGVCHHDENGEPLTELEDGQPVQKCIECHKIPGQVPSKVKKEWREKKIKGAEKKKLELQYHAEAVHDNCKDCHKKFNKKYKPKKAPTTCAKCHPKTKK
jgi:hypothetical protein